jgi:hypothetical protein
VVLVAAAVVAVALVAMLVAAVQLGYQPTPADASDASDLGDVERPLEKAVRRGATDAAGRFAWAQRDAAAAVALGHLRPAIEAVEGGGVAADVTYRVEQNDDAAAALASEVCPRGEDRVYGECDAVGAFVLQERAGEAHLLGVVVDVRVVGPGRRTRATLFVRPVG